jgi:hypothetical protein
MEGHMDLTKQEIEAIVAEKIQSHLSEAITREVKSQLSEIITSFALVKQTVDRHEIIVNGIPAITDAILKMSIGIETLTTNVTKVTTSVDKMETRLNDLIMRPAKRWETLVSDILKTLVALAVGAIFAWFMKK